MDIRDFGGGGGSGEINIWWGKGLGGKGWGTPVIPFVMIETPI